MRMMECSYTIGNNMSRLSRITDDLRGGNSSTPTSPNTKTSSNSSSKSIVEGRMGFPVHGYWEGPHMIHRIRKIGNFFARRLLPKFTKVSVCLIKISPLSGIGLLVSQVGASLILMMGPSLVCKRIYFCQNIWSFDQSKFKSSVW